MRATRRAWEAAAVGAACAVVAVATGRPVGLAGPIGIGAWLIATAWLAARTFHRTNRQLTVTYSLATPTAQLDSAVPVTLTVSHETASPTAVSVQTTLPPGVRPVDGAAPTVSLAAGASTASTTVVVKPAVAGEITLPSPTVHFDDHHGVFTEAFTRGPEPTLTVLPDTPTVHVGKGGNPYQNAFGEHATDQPGPGITTRELRQYVPGDAAADIDWKSTARLGEPYVRETEGETDRHTTLLVDHRGVTAGDANSDSPITYIREAALGMTAAAIAQQDPLGLYTVGDDGISEFVPAGSDPQTHTRVRTTLLELSPTAATQPPSARRGDATPLATRLDQSSASTPFTQTLRQYTHPTQQTPSVHHPDPLVGAIQQVRSRRGDGSWLVIVTTDSHPARLREAITHATANGGEALVCITPLALFESDQVTTLTDQYAAYTEFEELRRDLDAYPRVTALELAPGDRLDALLAARRATDAETHTP